MNHLGYSTELVAAQHAIRSDLMDQTYTFTVSEFLFGMHAVGGHELQSDTDRAQYYAEKAVSENECRTIFLKFKNPTLDLEVRHAVLDALVFLPVHQKTYW